MLYGTNPQDISWYLYDGNTGQDYLKMEKPRSASPYFFDFIQKQYLPAGKFRFVMTSRSGQGMQGDDTWVKILDASGKDFMDLTGVLVYSHDGNFGSRLEDEFYVN